MHAGTHDTRRKFRLGQRFSSVGLLVGTLLFAFSLTPSLLPRSVAFQGLVSGISMALGYSIGRSGRGLWSYLELPVPTERVQRQVILSIAALCFMVAALFLARATDWQNSVRALMGLEPVSGVRPFSVALMALLVFGVLHFLGWQFRKTVLFLSGKLRRVVPRRVANLLGLVGAIALFWAIADGVLLSALLRAADGSFRRIDAAIQDDMDRPDDPMKTGSAASIIDWRDLGRRGRTFVSSGPTAAELSAYHGETTPEPIRVYVGLNAAETPEERARLALRELIRVGAFARSVLLVVTPTGTGWVDPASLKTVEYLHRGNIATVAAQYSYLPSLLSLMVEGAYGGEMARALFKTVYGYWTTLPPAGRPRLYLHGVSLGAMNSDLSFDFFDILHDPFDGAFWSGPPFRSRTWRTITASRNPGSSEWLPQFRDGSIVRFLNQRGETESLQGGWGRFRIVYLQYASDPVTFFSARSLYRQPDWLRAPRGHDVSPALQWYPVVTAVQLAADIAAGMEAAPPGFGHNFAQEHFLDAWVALTDPPGWTLEDSRRLKAHLIAQ